MAARKRPCSTCSVNFHLSPSTDIPNPDARRETIEWYRSDFEKSRNEVDLVSSYLASSNSGLFSFLALLLCIEYFYSILLTLSRRPFSLSSYAILLSRLLLRLSPSFPQEKIKDLLTQGQRQLKMMQGPMQLSGRAEDFVPLRGSRS